MKPKFIFSGICLLIAVLLQLCARMVEGFANTYTQYIYPLWVNSMGRLMSIFPVSVVEVLLYLLLVTIVIVIFRNLLFCHGQRAAGFAGGALNLLVLASLLFCLYTVNCGINYFSESFSQKEAFEVKERPIEELYQMCIKLTEEVNSYSPQVIRNAHGLCVLENNVNERAVLAMQTAALEYPSLSGYYPRPKPLMISQILSVQQLSGIYSPFTIEANYNRHMVNYNIPFTACHELSHLRGFMREDEANFIAWLACRASEDIDFNYSGALLGWIYATNELYDLNRDMYNESAKLLAPEVWVDLEANSAFWDAYEGKTAEFADQINDTYLKVNNQIDGVRSYNRMVDLMLAYFAE